MNSCTLHLLIKPFYTDTLSTLLNCHTCYSVACIQVVTALFRLTHFGPNVFSSFHPPCYSRLDRKFLRGKMETKLIAWREGKKWQIYKQTSLLQRQQRSWLKPGVVQATFKHLSTFWFTQSARQTGLAATHAAVDLKQAPTTCLCRTSETAVSFCPGGCDERYFSCGEQRRREGKLTAAS